MKKAKDFIIPFSYEERRPAVLDQCFLIPKNYLNHDASVLPSFEDMFQNENPIHVEFCSGNGQWIIEKALTNPQINWVAVEIRFDRVRKIWVKMKNLGIKNLFIIFGDAKSYVEHYLDDNSIDHSYVNFPDPWPKEKHAKNRLIEESFLKGLSKKLKMRAPLLMVTDDFDTKDRMIEEALASQKFTPAYPAPYYIHSLEGYGGSYFDALWREKGKSIHYMKFLNQK
ncbi:MAG TPA: tRNA (guanine(46)-N(7))-methyltransferase TrmB [Chlamydiales bacterium]|nr:tRNA (guanine(46)-N(7))-methyltransferase TrmB [Chlamydiales bacterium]